MEHAFLANLWAALVGLMLMLYVVLDGFDLGIGILSLFTSKAEDRATMMASIGAFWDANETWLVIAGGALFGAFPSVYGIVLNALYIPIMLMLFGLVFRAVSFGFRAHARHKRPWEVAFGLGSLAAVLGQGFTLGGLLSQIRVGPEGFAGGPWDWLNLLSLPVAMAVGTGYTMIGASYLIAKTEGPVQRHTQWLLRISSVVTLVVIAVLSVLTPLLYDRMSQKWLHAPDLSFMAALGAGAAFSLVMLLLSPVYRKYPLLPFVWSLVMFVLAFGGLAFAIYPYLVPGSITITAAASSPPTLLFMLGGIGPLMPVMLVYNLYLYRVFRGKVSERAGYEESHGG
jgi:cytochrome d ubiquinol oxidase subunit II